MTTLREISKSDYISHDGPSRGAIKAGSLQRIADAMEKQANATDVIAQNWQRLKDERDMYERWYKDQHARAEKFYRRISALHGVITKLKKKSK